MQNDLKELLEGYMIKQRHIWRAFHCDPDDGGCNDTPDEVYAEAYNACLSLFEQAGVIEALELAAEMFDDTSVVHKSLTKLRKLAGEKS